MLLVEEKNMNQREHYMDVIITKEEETFKATTPLFPKCKGIGVTEKEALLKLSNSISNHIHRATKKHISSVLLGDNFSEVITDPLKKDEQKHKMFDLNPQSSSQKFNVFVKFSPFISPTPTRVKGSLFSDIEEFLISNAYLKESSIDLVTSEATLSANESEDGFVFGIPFCLN